jgi:nephrocystin-3
MSASTSRLVRVFISSTFRDFMGERDELVKRVFPELRRRCKARFVELLEVDLRWGITEEQSKSGETLRICLQEIDRCRPSAPVFFIGMLGERYGWIPPEDYYPESVTKDPELKWVKKHIGGKSVTELEILHGVLNNNVMRDKAFFYFRNDGYEKRHWPEIAEHHEGIVPPLTPEDFTNAKSENPAADEAKQQQLKKDICDASLAWDPRPYETPEELGKMVFQDLADAIDRIFPEDAVPGELERQALEHESFGESRARGYVPRLGLFEGLDRILEQPAPSVRVVTGESGGGKSALFAAWLQKRRGELPPRTFVHYIGGTPESSTARSIVLRLMETIRSWGLVKERVPDDFGEAVQLLPEWLGLAGDGQDRGILIVLDALNQLESPHDQTLWWLPKQLPAGVRLLVSTLPGPAEEELKSRGLMEEYLFVPALRDEEKKLIIASYLALFSRTLEQKHVTRLMGAPQTANPLFLKVVLDELRIRGRYEVLGNMISRMLKAKDPVGLFKQVLVNLEEYDKERPNLVRDALGYLATARRGLTESELLQLLSSSGNPANEPLPRSIWSPLYLALEESLVSRNGRLGFFHDFLRQAVEQEYLDEESEVRKIHAKFGEVAMAWDTGRYSPSLRSYGLAFGAYHLKQGVDHQGLWAILSHSGYRNAQLVEFRGVEEAVASLRHGVEAYAQRNGMTPEDDVRLCSLTLSCSEVMDEARSSLQPVFEEFGSAPRHDTSRAGNALNRLSILDAPQFYRACQLLLFIECRRSKESGIAPGTIILERILDALESKVSSETEVPFEQRWEERLVEYLPVSTWYRLCKVTNVFPNGTEIKQEILEDQSPKTWASHESMRQIFAAREYLKHRRWDDFQWLFPKMGKFEQDVLNFDKAEIFIEEGEIEKAKKAADSIEDNQYLRTTAFESLAESLQKNNLNQDPDIVEKRIASARLCSGDVYAKSILGICSLSMNHDVLNHGSLAELHSEGLEKARRESWSEKRCEAYLSLAEGWFLLCRPDTALEVLELALLAAREENSAKCLSDVAKAYAQHGFYEQSDDVVDSIEEGWGIGGYNGAHINRLIASAAVAWADPGNLVESFARWERVWEAYKNQTESTDRGTLLREFSKILIGSQDFDGKIKVMEEIFSESLLQGVFQSYNEDYQANALASEIVRLGDCQKAQKLSSTVKQEFSRAGCYGVIAKALYKKGEIEKSHGMLLLSLETAAQIEDIQTRLQSLQWNVGQFKLKNIDEKNRQYLHQALTRILEEAAKSSSPEEGISGRNEFCKETVIIALAGGCFERIEDKSKASLCYDLVKIRLKQIELPELRAVVSTIVAADCVRVQTYSAFQWFWIYSLESFSVKSQSMNRLSAIRRFGKSSAEEDDFRTAFHILNYFDQDASNADMLSEKISASGDYIRCRFKNGNAFRSLPDTGVEYHNPWLGILSLWSHAIQSAQEGNSNHAIATAELMSGDYLLERVKTLVDIAVIVSGHDKVIAGSIFDKAIQANDSVDYHLQWSARAYLYAGLIISGVTEGVGGAFSALESSITIPLHCCDFDSTDKLNRFEGDFLAEAFRQSPSDHPFRFFDRAVSQLESHEEMNSEFLSLEIIARMLSRSGSFHNISDLSMRLVELICRLDCREKSRVLGEFCESIITEGLAETLGTTMERIIIEVSEIREEMPAV